LRFFHKFLKVHFHQEVPSIYRGDLEEENEILIWLLANLEKSEIDEVCLGRLLFLQLFEH